nr:immunoglobulin heavy chain junction region [Macaca mulatta]MOW84104.1 immunoglobulin heavy chain junction region [Macaca mulatta]MOW84997.1 immunoglobulin heavy chain junction region [Macaca mulatta]MOW85182.1 immunoglobulin heavy chain junction region [Macaca mulatta]MOW85193.1 immunoglobulin heavy chain junction region [Macaca mulatta]
CARKWSGYGLDFW